MTILSWKNGRKVYTHAPGARERKRHAMKKQIENLNQQLKQQIDNSDREKEKMKQEFDLEKVKMKQELYLEMGDTIRSLEFELELKKDQIARLEKLSVMLWSQQKTWSPILWRCDGIIPSWLRRLKS